MNGVIVRGLTFVERSRTRFREMRGEGERIYRSAEVDGFNLDVVEFTNVEELPFYGTVWCGTPHNHRSEEQYGKTLVEVVDLLISTKALWSFLL